ncbi:MAG: LytTR family DNA-binding domain-containing protein [Bacteroidia bacterium]|nr:LytTR family DNA-binding domain-containing protein [Bacteroidia bacterium]MDW8302691.1 LytTR family DNA-binding domain-containing protein [Bacteroidia bacterium]
MSNKVLDCLIVDDEPLAHQVIENYIQKVERLKIVGNCYNAVDTINFLHKTPVDLIFLDINMPELTGIDLLKTLQDPPLVILTTAYSEFALEGYELGVTDYLLKPIRFDRFLKAVNRALDIFDRQVPTELVAPSSPNSLTEKTSSIDHILAKSNGITHKIMLDKIHFIQSYGNFIKIFTDEKVYLTAETMKNIEATLSESHFIRVHKSYLVNTQYIEKILSNSMYVAGTEIPIGNTYKQILHQKLKLK